MMIFWGNSEVVVLARRRRRNLHLLHLLPLSILTQKLMRQALRRRKSFFTVDFQHSLQKLTGRRVQVAVFGPCQVELKFLIFIENRLGAFSLEEIAARQ